MENTKSRNLFVGRPKRLLLLWDGKLEVGSGKWSSFLGERLQMIRPPTLIIPVWISKRPDIAPGQFAGASHP